MAGRVTLPHPGRGILLPGLLAIVDAKWRQARSWLGPAYCPWLRRQFRSRALGRRHHGILLLAGEQALAREVCGDSPDR